MALAGGLIGVLTVAAIIFDKLPAGDATWWAARGILLFFMVFGWSLWVAIEMR